LVAIALWPNITCNNAITGRDIYHQNFSYLATSQSMIGKFITAEMITITTINCLISNFIRYPLAMMSIPTRKHNAKKT
jgi:hypothetical protein